MDIGTTETMQETARAAARADGLVDDVIVAFSGAAPTFERSIALGVAWHAAGGDAVALLREAARAGRELAARVESEGELDARRRQRLAELIDEAGAHALEGFLAAARGRRDRWLSHYAHEMRNALNTLVNAHWIFKNSEGKQSTKIFGMADRAVRRLEAAVEGVRALEEHALGPAPGRPDKK